MIQANSLRIGNWFIWSPLASMGIGYDYIETGSDINMYNQLKDPIPLTPEILEKCGFKKWGRDDYPRTLSYELGEMTIFPSNSFCDFEGYGFMHYKKSTFENNKDESARFKFKYLHQLQNLYFALTGEELSVTL